MAQIFNFQDHMIFIAEHNNLLACHKHLASHIIISLGEEMSWKIENEHIKCRGICINSDTQHKGIISEKGSIAFLFTETSKFAASLNKKYLNNNLYAVLDIKIIDKILEEYKTYKNDIKILDRHILDICGINGDESHGYDNRIDETIKYIEDLETIEHGIVDDLCKKIYLSKSRLSHLFKEQTKMTLHSYLSFEKLHKTYEYLENGLSITEACLKAGFSSSAHCASTCKRMFGMSLTDIYKSKNSI